MNQIITMSFDIVLAILLIATISYCARLSRRIKVLQDSRSELGEMILQFDHATTRAMASVNDLQTVSKKITEALQLKIDKANFMADDLAFLIEKSTKLVLQLEQANSNNKSKATYELSPQQIMKPKSSPELQSSLGAVLQRLADSDNGNDNLLPRTGAERDLIKALKVGR